MTMAYIRPEGDLREALAALQHDIWAHWMKYQFSCCLWSVGEGPNLPKEIPSEKAERWLRQMNTHYDVLSDKERDSDREQADKILALLDRPEFLPSLQELVQKLQKQVAPFDVTKELNRLRHESGITLIVNESRGQWRVTEVDDDFPHGHFKALSLINGSPYVANFSGHQVSEHDRGFVRVDAEFWYVTAYEDDQTGRRCLTERLIFVPTK